MTTGRDGDREYDNRRGGGKGFIGMAGVMGKVAGMTGVVWERKQEDGSDGSMKGRLRCVNSKRGKGWAEGNEGNNGKMNK